MGSADVFETSKRGMPPGSDIDFQIINFTRLEEKNPNKSY